MNRAVEPLPKPRRCSECNGDGWTVLDGQVVACPCGGAERPDEISQPTQWDPRPDDFPWRPIGILAAVVVALMVAIVLVRLS